MRLVGYVREKADPSVDRPAFSQQEEIRRYADEHGHRLVAVCQDLRSPGRAPSRDGYLSLLGVIASGGVDAVVVPGLDTFSSDAILQEVVLWDLGSRGVRVISTEPADGPVLDPEDDADPSRIVIRDVLQRVEEHSAATASLQAPPHGTTASGDVVVKLIQADDAGD